MGDDIESTKVDLQVLLDINIDCPRRTPRTTASLQSNPVRSFTNSPSTSLFHFKPTLFATRSGLMEFADMQNGTNRYGQEQEPGGTCGLIDTIHIVHSCTFSILDMLLLVRTLICLNSYYSHFPAQYRSPKKSEFRNAITRKLNCYHCRRERLPTMCHHVSSRFDTIS